MERISNDIDFAPIFRVSRENPARLPSNADTVVALQTLARVALEVSTKRGALRHDLMGRIFHRLLADPKYYGAFYTKIPAATLLLKLAIEECDWPVKWDDPGSVGSLTVSDLACGTGTLLKAALSAAVDRHISEAAAEGVLPDSKTVHRLLLERGLWGFDVVASAVHLAAAAVAMHDPNVSVLYDALLRFATGGRRTTPEAIGKHSVRDGPPSPSSEDAARSRSRSEERHFHG